MQADTRRSSDSTSEQSTPRPSQAEGSPDPGTDDGDEESIPMPSQAEGDLATIEDDLERQVEKS